MVSKAARDAALKERWNQKPVETEALMHREQYKKLYELLLSGRVHIKVVPKNTVFVHGKASSLSDLKYFKKSWKYPYKVLY